MRQLSFLSMCAIGLTSALFGALLSADVHLPQLQGAFSPLYATSVQRHVVYCPDPGSAGNRLDGVTAISPDDIWAVGVYRDAGYSGYFDAHTLTMHWDGKKWTPIYSPDPPGNPRILLYGVASLTSDDVWTVGTYQPVGNFSWTLVEHWDGKGWSIVPSPNPPNTGFSELHAIAALSRNDVWAVGRADGRTLIEHWDGKTWAIIPSPNLTEPTAEDYQLDAISAASATDIWAVGYYRINDKRGTKALILHWDGRSWSSSPLPSSGLEDYSALHGVASISNGEAWAVGGYGSNTPLTYSGLELKTLVLHWDGKQWVIVPSPNPGIVNNLSAIAARSPNDIWAVGNSSDSTTILLHWDGRTWSSVVKPKTRPSWNELTGISIASVSNIWAVGYFRTDETRYGTYETLTELYTVSH